MQYDAFDSPHPDCGINTTTNANLSCTISFTTDQDLEPPIMVYYEIENFHQNHRTYQKSRDVYQLFGAETQFALDAALCDPLNILGDVRLNPCGLTANTFFNDEILLTTSGIDMLETGIAWQSDLDYMFRQPDSFKSAPCPEGTCDPSCCDGDEWSCDEPAEKDGVCHSYFYADDNKTQYLHETYNNINALDGVLNEHFIVWMRIAALPTFRKLYGWIDQPIAAGTTLTFDIVNNWEVSSFSGRKSLVMTTTNIFGGRNDWLGMYYYVVGFFCLGVAFFAAIKQTFRPRRMGDKRYLKYKQL